MANPPNPLNLVASALTNEDRLDIITYLRNNGETCVSELADALGIEQSRLSFHLCRLKDAGVVDARTEGRYSYYSLDSAQLRAYAQAVLELVGEDGADVAADLQERCSQYRES